MEFETKKYVVGYFDLLGTKQNLKENKDDAFFKLWLISHNLSKMKSRYPGLVVRTFTDNFLVAMELDEKNKFDSLNSVLQAISYTFAQTLLSTGALLRGSVVVGDMHIDEDILLGDALLRAYYLESNVCVYPRLITDDSIRKILPSVSTKLHDYNTYVFSDIDGVICFNFLRFLDLNYIKVCGAQMSQKLDEEYMKLMEKKLDKEAARIKWSKNYIDGFLNDLSSGKILFSSIVK